MASISALGIGSGLDLNGLLGQLNEAERGKLEPIERQIESQQVQISAYGEIQSALSGFQSSARALNDASLYESLSANVAGESVQATAGPEAAPGQYTVEVERLASAGTLTTQRVGAPDEPILNQAALADADGKLELNFAGDDVESVRIAIDPDSSLEGIRDAINAHEGAGVVASVVNDGEGYRLALSSTATGEAASIVSTNFADLTAGSLAADPGSTVVEGGEDAALNINGIAITSTTNQVEGAVQGVTLNLQQAGSSTLQVEQDTRAVREAVAGFVESFNALKGTIGEHTAFDQESGQAGELLGDSAVRTLEARLRNDLSAMLGTPGEDAVALLSDVGISLERDGTLSLDEARLDSAVANQMSGVGEFFAGAGDALGMAGRLDQTAEQLLAGNGAVGSAITSAENRIDSLGERYVRMEQSIEQTLERYRTQFGQLDGMIAQMNQTSDYLTRQFAALDAQLGRD
ncbi:flagellar filament capping protein FliD [Halomonas mongoliensis]|uniref:flagellar filament capping protein FliD n=1 Tax=Halomonas mongoliensis TaxID=321265 RepID=UPI00403B01CC